MVFGRVCGILLVAIVLPGWVGLAWASCSRSRLWTARRPAVSLRIAIGWLAAGNDQGAARRLLRPQLAPGSLLIVGRKAAGATFRLCHCPFERLLLGGCGSSGFWRLQAARQGAGCL